jgi:hypothetical protein
MTTLVTRIVICPESRVWIWRRTGSREPANAAEALARSWPSRTSDYPRGASCTANEPRPTREEVDQQRPQPRRATAQTAGRRGARTVPCPPELTALLREQFHGVRGNLAAASRLQPWSAAAGPCDAYRPCAGRARADAPSCRYRSRGRGRAAHYRARPWRRLPERGLWRYLSWVRWYRCSWRCPC